MDIAQIRQTISKKTGIPVKLLTGQTIEENLKQAKNILDYRQGVAKQQQAAGQLQKSTSEQFADWITERAGITTDSLEEAGTDQVMKNIYSEFSDYPLISDPGEISLANTGSGKPAGEQFEEWLGQKAAYDPFSYGNGWHRLL